MTNPFCMQPEHTEVWRVWSMCGLTHVHASGRQVAGRHAWGWAPRWGLLPHPGPAEVR